MAVQDRDDLPRRDRVALLDPQLRDPPAYAGGQLGRLAFEEAGEHAAGAGALLLHIPAAELAALAFAAAGIWGTLGPFWAMSSESLSGTGAAAGIALINAVGNLGGFLGPYLVGLIRGRTGSFTEALLALALFPIIGAIVTLNMPRASSGASE